MEAGMNERETKVDTNAEPVIPVSNPAINSEVKHYN
jgi:hypothetical protein